MAGQKTFRLVTGTSQTPATAVTDGTIEIFADASGRLVGQNIGGAKFLVGTFATGAVAQTAVRTGVATFLLTGTVYGETQNTLLGTGLGTPFRWLPFLDSTGGLLAVPAYRYS
jgi:hypothetical protein